MARGYIGKILFVNLSTGELKDEVLEEKLCHDFIGGYGIGARILYTRQKGGVDPLGPQNTLGLVTGPLTGTRPPWALGTPQYQNHPSLVGGEMPTREGISVLSSTSRAMMVHSSPGCQKGRFICSLITERLN